MMIINKMAIHKVTITITMMVMITVVTPTVILILTKVMIIQIFKTFYRSIGENKHSYKTNNALNEKISKGN